MIKSFQGIRGIAIIIIILSHCYSTMTFFGAFGVSLFIMLSGFLLYEKYFFLELTYKDLPKYLKSKLMKFYPLHILTLLIAIPISIFELKGYFSIKEFIKLGLNVLLLQGWIPSAGVYFSYNAVSWYLSITVFFIVVSPAVLFLIKKMNNNKIVTSIIGVLIFQLCLVLLFENSKIAHWIVYVCPLVRSLDFFVGAGIYALARNKKLDHLTTFTRELCIGVCFLICCIILYFSLNAKSEMFSSLIWTIPSFFIIYLVYSGDNNSWIVNSMLKNRVIMFVGDISFYLFLIHQLVIRYMKNLYNLFHMEQNITMYGIAIIISFCISGFIWCYKKYSYIQKGKTT